MQDLFESGLEAERAIFNTDHTAVGRWIAQKWKLPQSMIDVILLHHHAAPALGALKENAHLVAIVALANIMAHATLMDSGRTQGREGQVQAGLQKMLGLREKDIQEIMAAFGPAFAERAEPFNLDGDQVTLV